MLRKLSIGFAIFVILTVMAGLTAAAPAGDPAARPPTKTPTPPAGSGTPIQIFGVWHCGNHYCDWSSVRNMTEFDTANHWLIDRGDGRPSVNLVVLSFVNPVELLNLANGNGLPVGMTQDIVDYFKSHGIRVMLSIGGITYTDDWDIALGEDSVTSASATQLGLNAAAVAQAMGVGIEIDYEQNTDPKLNALQAFINAYRSQLPYDASGNNHAARLTIDVAAGDRWLIALNRHATANWLTTSNPVLDYANAMVPGTGQPSTADWQEHVDGKPNYNPVVLPLAPAKFTGALWLKGNNNECLNFSASYMNSYSSYVTNVQPNGAGTTPGMLGYMFWAAETPSSRQSYVSTTPPNSCEPGMGVGATTFNIQIPMPPLRQQ